MYDTGQLSSCSVAWRRFPPSGSPERELSQLAALSAFMVGRVADAGRACDEAERARPRASLPRSHGPAVAPVLPGSAWCARSSPPSRTDRTRSRSRRRRRSRSRVIRSSRCSPTWGSHRHTSRRGIWRLPWSTRASRKPPRPRADPWSPSRRSPPWETHSCSSDTATRRRPRAARSSRPTRRRRGTWEVARPTRCSGSGRCGTRPAMSPRPSPTWNVPGRRWAPSATVARSSPR